MAKTAYVVGIGSDTYAGAGGYLIDGKSRSRLNKFTKGLIADFQRRAPFGTTLTHGKIVRMPYTSLRKELPGFTKYAEPCLELRGIVIVKRMRSGYAFTCIGKTVAEKAFGAV